MEDSRSPVGTRRPQPSMSTMPTTQLSSPANGGHSRGTTQLSIPTNGSQASAIITPKVNKPKAKKPKVDKQSDPNVSALAYIYHLTYIYRLGLYFP